MAATPRSTQNPRKTPRQARSAATVDAIFEATIQVLLADGLPRLTTTRVAERAGVSVGTIYQYFPHKKALLYAVLGSRLERVAHAVETTCLAYQGESIAVMADVLANAYLDAKTSRADAARALYSVASELDTASMMDALAERLDTAMKSLLASAADAKFNDLPGVTIALRAALAGTVRSVLERDATPPMVQVLRSELPKMCRAYLVQAA